MRSIGCIPAASSQGMSMERLRARTAVVGVARSGTPFTPGKTSLQLHAELAREAVADAGLAPGDVDGVLTAGCDEPTYCEDVAHSAVLCEYMGLRPRFTYSVDLGTPVFAKMVEITAAAITGGLCHTVLIACAEPTVSRASRRGAVEKMAGFGHPDFELPYGVSIPAFYALIARRHMHEFGTAPEQLARVAVAMRRHAGLNPGARFREPLSVDDVLESRLAVIGASRSPGKAGFHQVDNLRRHYSGAVFPVNPNADRIAGYRCHPSLDAARARGHRGVHPGPGHRTGGDGGPRGHPGGVPRRRGPAAPARSRRGESDDRGQRGLPPP